MVNYFCQCTEEIEECFIQDIIGSETVTLIIVLFTFHGGSVTSKVVFTRIRYIFFVLLELWLVL